MATRPQDIFGALSGGGIGPLPGIDIFGPSDNGAMAPAAAPASNSPAMSSPLNYMRDVQPSLISAEDPQAAIRKLTPGSDRHTHVYNKLEAMYKFSKREMEKHYWRWNFAEQKIQAYTSVTDYERLVTELQQQDALPPEPVTVIMPYSYATLHAAATFVANVLLGRKPTFPLMPTRGTETKRARYMEQAIQSGLDSSRGQETLWQHIWDSLVYGFGVNRNQWEERSGNAIRFVMGRREMTTETIFAGNVTTAIDPYAFFPDPRVPIHQCNLRGDFMFTEMQQSETVLRDMERSGEFMFVDEAIRRSKSWDRSQGRAQDENRRRLKIGIRGEHLIAPSNVIGFHSVFEGTVRIVPKDWKLGESDVSELWKFAWLRGQIIQAEPLGMAHSMHPYVASEPTSFGHDFMSLSMHDMIGPFQDILSWLVSSRMENVRTAINNQFVADPARVDVNDMRASPIGRIIRLKQAAMGLPVKEAIMQLLVQDVTQGHIADIQTMRVLADTITGVNDNMRGIQNQGGRRSATEARMSMQAGASRLSQLAVRISSQAWLPLATQMIMNIQQFMPDKMWVEVTGDDGVPNSTQLTANMLMGSFNYQISDGTLPFDKQAMIEQWKEILFGIARDPELRARWDISEIFRYVADLGGARNIDSFQRAQNPMMAGPGGQPVGPGQIPFVAGAQANPAAAGMMPIGIAQPPGPIA